MGLVSTFLKTGIKAGITAAKHLKQPENVAILAGEIAVGFAAEEIISRIDKEEEAIKTNNVTSMNKKKKKNQKI